LSLKRWGVNAKFKVSRGEVFGNWRKAFTYRGPGIRDYPKEGLPPTEEGLGGNSLGQGWAIFLI